ncbi:MAG: VCBS repeat-containing protein [Cyclobacteriaceae bacterium]
MKVTLPLLFLLLLLASCQNNQEETTAPPLEPTTAKEEVKPFFQQKEADETGLYFINELKDDPYRNILVYQYYYNGGGVAAGDVNNDGKTDLFFTGNSVANKLYLNLGNFQFKDITLESGLAKSSSNSWCTGVNMADVNGDGLLDIYVCRSGNLQAENRENLLFINQGVGADGMPSFVEQGSDYGLNDPGYSVQSAFFDYDHDGDLDMFLINHGMDYYSGMIVSNDGRRDPYIGDKLFRNDNGFFKDVSAEAGIEGSKHGYGLGLAVGDLNDDGWDDIYVANDFYEHDYLYLNQGDGSFAESIHQSVSHLSFFGMGVDLADYNNDALPDIVVLDMAAEDHYRQKTNLAGITKNKFRDFVESGYHHQYMFNSLQLNRGQDAEGKPVFSNIAQMAGMDQTDWSWAPLLADLDNDGWKDLFVSNGLRKDVLNNDFIQATNDELRTLNTTFVNLPPAQAQQILDKMPSEKVSNYFFRNKGDLTFQNVTAEWSQQLPSFSNGAAYADLDNDGDLDLVVNQLDDFAGIYENQLPRGKRHFLRLKLRAAAPNPLAFGARAYLYQQGKAQYQQLYPSRGFQSSVEPLLHFGLGDNPKVDSLSIVWPDGRLSTFYEPEVDQTLVLQPEGAEMQTADSEKAAPWLEEVPSRLPFTHQENDFDDFDRQFLLPHKLSAEGPALAVADVNGDGLDDVYAGGAAGQAPALLIQKNDGSFEPAAGPWQQDAAQEDVDAVFFDVDGDSDQDLYVVSGGVEFEPGSPLLQDRLYLNDGKGQFIKAELPAVYANGMCAAPADFDGDGDTDLFVGAGSLPGSYPLVDQSLLLENQNGQLIDVTAEKGAALKNIGIVRDAIWTDHEQDGRQELLLVGEWMPPTLLSWQQEKLMVNQEVRFHNTSGKAQQLHGWWHSVHAFDFDEDGDEDYLLGNVGLNYRYQASEKEPLQMFAYDMDENGYQELFLSYYQQGRLLPAHERDEIYQQWREIKKRYPIHAAYAQASLPEIMGPAFDKALQLRADTLAHIILYNEGKGRFRVEALPHAGQISVLKDALFTDITGDGRKELLTVGNFYHTSTQIPRLDASLGQVYQLRDGSLTPISPQLSGLFANGDIRKMVLVRNQQGKSLLTATNDGPLRYWKVKE